MNKKFYLGLDIGTDSVGWAVTDENYNLVRKQGKHLWGARLFPEASDASTRRANREARRRLQRRRWRILMLQDLFKDEMNKVDPNFFDRLNNSALLMEDKADNAKAPYLLFNDDDFTDKDYGKKYPTIYHLRKEMMETPDKKYDIRQIYLVMAHMIKYRGNFLTESDVSGEGDTDNVATLVSGFNELDNLFRDNVEDGEEPYAFNCTEDIAKRLITIFQEENRSKYLMERITEAFAGKDFSSLQKNLLKLISGSKMQAGALFSRLKEEDEDISKKSIEFDNANYEQTIIDLSQTLSDYEMSLIQTCNKIFSFRVLINLLKGKHYISDAMVEIYDTHKEQLKILKDLVKRYNPNEYKNFFVKINGKDGKPMANYVNYIGLTCNNKKKIRLPHSTSQENFYKAVKALLPLDKPNENYPEEDRKRFKDILSSIEGKKYLIRQNSKENGVFPYQLNKDEMERIIENQKKYYPFLAETSSDYINPSKQSPKLVSLLEFKIPYYVGPLSNKMEGTKNFWMERKQDGKITPWNFHDIVDEEKTAEGFIDRMKNACTYLIGEATLPKNSLLYSEFMLLNEINNWQINDKPIDKETKDYLIENFYMKSTRTPSVKNIVDLLKLKFKQTDIKTISVTTKTGKELSIEDIHANLKTFVDMANPRGFGPEFYKVPDKYELAEQVIFIITMFEDKSLKYKKLKALKLSDDQVKYFMGLKYADWGKLSKKLLNGLKTELVNQQTGEALEYTIIDIMREEPLNLMEILETNDSEYTFREQISELNQEASPDREDLIENSYASPAMKKSVRQTFKIIDELKHILHIDHFDTFFVECTRRKEDSKRTNSRKKQLQDMLNDINLRDIVGENDLAETLENRSEADLKKKKLFLYYMQLGRSPYSGKKIDLNRLDQDYDIDHIIPQAKLKDDSFLNIVLVEKNLNNLKQDTYPIPSNVLSDEGREWVKKLNDKCKKKDGSFQSMPDDKMRRILRSQNNPLTDDELVGFVNRQLTMTDQSVKAVCEILRETERESKIVYSKASNVSEFRGVFGLPKCREINDFHHANDAYLNIVVGNVYDKVFTSRFTTKLFREHFDDSRSWKIDVKNFFKRDEYAFNIIDAGRCVWKAKRYQDSDKQIEDLNSTGTIDIVRKTLSWNDPMVTQMLFTQSAKQGFFNKISIHSAKDGDAAFPLKWPKPKSDKETKEYKRNIHFVSDGWKEKYGGYSDLTAPYFMLVESDGKKGTKKYTLENIPSIYCPDKMSIKEKNTFLEEKCGLKDKNPKIILHKLLIRTVIEFPHEDGKVRVGISGKSDPAVEFVNLSEPAISKELDVTYLKSISKVLGVNANAGDKIDTTYLQDKDSVIVNKVELNKDKNCKVYNEIIKTILTKTEYLKLPEVGKKIQMVKETTAKFAALTFYDQLNTIIEILKLSGCHKLDANLEKIGLGKNKHVRVNKELPRPFRIIQQSPTGFYEKVLFEIGE